MALSKACPYCTKPLPFFNLVKQRLSFSEDKAVVCPACTSTISVRGHASVWASLGASTTCVYLLGKLVGGLSVESLLFSGCVGLVVFIVLLYVTAPIRDA